MRIAMLTNNYKPFVGGVPISIERLSEGLRSLGHEVYIFAPTYENQIEEAFVIRYKSFDKSYNGLVMPNIMDSVIRKKFEELKIDVIHVHHPMLIGWMALYLGKKYAIPVVCTYHTRYEQYIHNIGVVKGLENLAAQKEGQIVGDLSLRSLQLLRERIVPKGIRSYLNRCQMVLAPTPLMRKILVDQGVAEPVEVLPTGLNEGFFKQDRQKALTIRNRYIEDKKYLFCSVSRLAKEKNITFILEGLEELKKQMGSCFRMLMIGEGPLKEVLMMEAAERGLAENIVFLGNIPNKELKHYYSAADLFLFASQSETQGIVLLEAMAAHTPVVAVRASGVVDVVKDHENGFMTAENHKEWMEHIVYLMNHQVEWENLKEGAYETAYNYSSEKVARQAACYYETVVKGYEEQCGRDLWEDRAV